MKRFFTALILMSALITGCASNSDSMEPIRDKTQETDIETESNDEAMVKTTDDQLLKFADDTEKSDSNVLVAYFSRMDNIDFDESVDAVTSASINNDNGDFAGNAAILADYASKASKGDIFSIQTEEKYPSAYRETTDIAADEKADNARPALSTHVENMEQYDTVILIYPNWWGTIPMPVAAFLEEYDFSGKKILPVCTHEGSAMGDSENDINKIVPEADIVSGLSIRGGSVKDSENDVVDYINGNI